MCVWGGGGAKGANVPLTFDWSQVGVILENRDDIFVELGKSAVFLFTIIKMLAPN